MQYIIIFCNKRFFAIVCMILELGYSSEGGNFLNFLFKLIDLFRLVIFRMITVRVLIDLYIV